MKLVLLNGACCSGKSTLIAQLMQQKERYFHLSYDVLKWQFSQYSSGKNYDDIQTLRLSMLRTLCEMEYNVFTESVHRASRQKHIDIATSYGYEIVEVNIEADYAVLVKRWEERVAKKSQHGDASRFRFDELFQAYEGEKNLEAFTIRTDQQSPDEAAANILKFL